MFRSERNLISDVGVRGILPYLVMRLLGIDSPRARYRASGRAEQDREQLEKAQRDHEKWEPLMEPLRQDFRELRGRTTL